MFCPNCRAKIPDEAEICPVCSKSTDKPVRKRFHLLKLLIIFSDYFTLVANAVNIVLLITASHMPSIWNTDSLLPAQSDIISTLPLLPPISSLVSSSSSFRSSPLSDI